MHFLGIEDTFWGYKSIFSGKDSTFLGKEVTFLGINLKKSAFWWLGVFLFYVLRFFLTMGIVRAQYSKCHPRHFFISRSSVGKMRRGIRGIKVTAILRNSTFGQKLHLKVNFRTICLQMCNFCCNFATDFGIEACYLPIS